MILLLVALIALSITSWRLARWVSSDGYGRNPAPRSHVEELDAWSRR